jgi:Ran GTPase-activating protein (RanGAP) involved in mRNA processing and transport
LLSEAVSDAEITVLSTHLAKYQPTVPAIFAGGKRITDVSIQALAKHVLVGNTVNLQRIYLQSTRMSDFGAGAMAQALLSNATLTVLSLTNCNITHHGAEKLANGLRRNSTLTRLDLKHNSIGNRGLRAIVTAIHDPPHPSLVSLNVGSNEISDYGLSTLTSFARLEELHLANNNITDHGALDLAKACLENHGLRWLSLQGNQLSPKGIQALTLFLLPSVGVLESDSQRRVTLHNST